MASATKKLSIVRERKEAKRGKSRKRREQNKGTTKSQAELFGDSES